LDRWVLERACRDAAAFSGLAEGIDVAVNLSARHLGEPDILKHVSEALLHSGLAADRLLLEVTESAVMEDAEAAAAALDALSQMGVRIAIDDFGTGYSSLLYVRRFPVSALKLDRAFVSGIDLNPGDEAICGSVVSLAHAVGATSIAEGVETMEQYAALGAFGCQQAQGYLWSPAVAVEELADVLLTCAAVPLLVSTATAGEKQKSDAITRAVAVAADKTAEGAESARVARAAAVTLAADTVALTAAKPRGPCDCRPRPQRRRWRPRRAMRRRHSRTHCPKATPQPRSPRFDWRRQSRPQLRPRPRKPHSLRHSWPEPSRPQRPKLL
jgi:EAL domain-containing protein (putative c-di-GMP-specific phosphodiesterase class I)